MMLFNLILISLVVILLVWVSVLTYFYITSLKHYRMLKADSKEFSIEEVLKTLVKRFSLNDAALKELQATVEKLKISDLSNVSNVGLVRFNPYEDTGGDLSFSLAILDKHKDGIVISSLHGRAGTRVYSKKVKSGGKDMHELSKEEKDAILSAMGGPL